MSRLSAERFNMQQRIKEGRRAARANVHTDPPTGLPVENNAPTATQHDPEFCGQCAEDVYR